MKSLIRLQPFFCSNSNCKLLHFRFSNSFRFSQFSSLARPSRPKKKSYETHLKNRQQVENGRIIGSLFNEITDILVSENSVSDEISSGASVLGDIEKEPECTPSVRQNAEQGEKDFSSIVYGITQIVRREKYDPVSMEERLEKSGLEFSDPVIVDKVLKRCFKVPHLAMRFFNLVNRKEGFVHTTKIYNTMLSVAREAKEFGFVEKLVADMDTNSCEKDIKTWTILISHYGKAKRIGKALSVFDKMTKSGIEPDKMVYKAMVRSLCEAEKPDIAMEFYKEMAKRDFGLDLNSYKLLLSCVARSGDSDSVRIVSDDMARVTQVPNEVVYGCVLKSFCISGRIREALEFIRDRKDKDSSFSYENFETLVKGLCRADRIGDALEILEIMKRRQIADAGIYGVVISGYLRRNEISRALELFRATKESGHSPTAFTYTALMQKLFGSGRYEEGLELYNEMLEGGIELDIVAMTAVAAGHVRAQRVDLAWEVFRAMEGKGIQPTWKSYSVFVRELCRVSNTEEILNVLNEMRRSEIVIGDDVFHWVTSYLERKGDADNLERVNRIRRGETDDGIIGKMEKVDPLDKSEPPEALESIQKAYNEKGLIEIRRILSSHRDWQSIQEALENSGVEFTPELVAEVLRNCGSDGGVGLKFFSWVGERSGYGGHTPESYNAAVKLAGRGKDFRHMRGLFHEMRRNRLAITPDSWTILIMQYGRTGLTSLALHAFQEMRASRCDPTAATYKYLIISLCSRKGRKATEAVKLFHEMVRTGFVPDKELVESYLACLCEVGDLSAAKKCVEALQRLSGFTAALSYSLYVRALCRAGRLEEALALGDEMIGAERSTLDEFTYGSVFHGLLRKGRVEEALAKMGSMKKAGINPTVHVYTSLIVHYLKEKRLDKALETLGTMREEGIEPTIVTHSAFLRGYVDMGKVAEAWDVFDRMREKGPAPDFKTYSMFISCLCKAGRSEEAMKLIDGMLNDGIVPSCVNFRTVFFGLNREGKQSLARTVMHRKQSLVRNRKFLG